MALSRRSGSTLTHPFNTVPGYGTSGCRVQTADLIGAADWQLNASLTAMGSGDGGRTVTYMLLSVSYLLETSELLYILRSDSTWN
jgi:hypothetical protein